MEFKEKKSDQKKIMHENLLKKAIKRLNKFNFWLLNHTFSWARHFIFFIMLVFHYLFTFGIRNYWPRPNYVHTGTYTHTVHMDMYVVSSSFSNFWMPQTWLFKTYPTFTVMKSMSADQTANFYFARFLCVK